MHKLAWEGRRRAAEATAAATEGGESRGRRLGPARDFDAQPTMMQAWESGTVTRGGGGECRRPGDGAETVLADGGECSDSHFILSVQHHKKMIAFLRKWVSPMMSRTERESSAKRW